MICSLSLKNSVNLRGIRPEMVFAALICASVFDEANQRLTFTSITDGVHKSGSCHYCGSAFDIRTRDLRGCLPAVMASRLQEALGSEFEVIVEPDHIHVEFVYYETSENLAASL